MKSLNNGIRKLLRARGDLQATLMATVLLLVVFEVVTWTDFQIAAVETAIGMWLVIGQRLYDVDLERLARDTEKPQPSVEPYRPH